MLYALVHFPDIDTARINQLRNKYDPLVAMIEPHITLVFPVEESIGEQSIILHIGAVLSGWRSFPIRLYGLSQSWDDYLFLSVSEGHADLIGLHGELYTGVLASYRKADLSFVPHVTLGVFTGKPGRCAEALIEAESMNLDYRGTVDRFHLVTINNDRTSIVRSKEFKLDL